MKRNNGGKDAPLSDQTTRAWLTLLRAPGIGNRTLHDLLARNGDPRYWLDKAARDRLPEKLRAWLNSPDQTAIEQDLRWLTGPNHHLIPITSPNYPALLRESPDPPVALFVLGDPLVLDMPQIAMVGSRNPSRGGEQTAAEFAAHFASHGLAVTSGLALGIDGASHRGALRAGGTTVAVAGTGLDRVYPARHRDLAHQIVAAGGTLVSEFPPGTPPRPGHFPRRNRVISGLALGTLVVEAALRSGSLITARLALEQGREVFAIPGSIHNPLARGCHALIRDGAKLVETAQDAIEELGALLGKFVPQPEQTTPTERNDALQDPDYQVLLHAMGYDPVSVDTLAERTAQGAAEISSMLLLLELEGHVSSAPGGLFSRISTVGRLD